MINAVGYTLQKRTLTRVGTQYLKAPQWWVGFLLLIAAETLGGVAMVLMPASVVVALGGLSVLFSSLFASVTEPCRLGLVLATFSITIGSVLFGLSITDGEEVDTVFGAILSVSSAVYHACAFLTCLLIHIFRRTRLVYLASYAGIVASVTAIWYRPLVALFLEQRFELFTSSPLPYVSVLLLATTGPYTAAYLEPLGLRLYPQTEWIPVHFVACFVFFSIAGEVVYEDWRSRTFTNRMILFVPLAFVNIILGVIAIARRW